MGGFEALAGKPRPHAVILAGGKGVRRRLYTTCLPPPLVSPGEECSILEVVLRQLARAGFGTVGLAIGHLGLLIRTHVGDGRQRGVDVHWWEGDSPLGTAPVAHRGELPGDPLVMNGDILTDLPFGDLLTRRRAAGAR